MEEMLNNKNIRKEIEKKAEKLAEEEKNRYIKDMQALKSKEDEQEEEDDDSSEEENIGPSIEFKDVENPEDVNFLLVLNTVFNKLILRSFI